MHAITRHIWQLILTIGGIIAQIRSHLGPHFQNCFVILFKSTYVFATGSTKGMATPPAAHRGCHTGYPRDKSFSFPQKHLFSRSFLRQSSKDIPGNYDVTLN